MLSLFKTATLKKLFCKKLKVGLYFDNFMADKLFLILTSSRGLGFLDPMLLPLSGETAGK